MHENLESLLETIRPEVGDRWHADEVWVKIRGDVKYLFVLMDSQTRYVLAQEVAGSKHRHNARSLLRAAKETAGKKPEEFVTDGLRAYRLAYLKEFRTLTKPRTDHVQDAHFNDKFDNNNVQERLNGEFRDLEKVTRGLKKDDSATIRGFRVHHNCIKPHMGPDGNTPADRAGIIRVAEQVAYADTECCETDGRRRLAYLSSATSGRQAHACNAKRRFIGPWLTQHVVGAPAKQTAYAEHILNVWEVRLTVDVRLHVASDSYDAFVARTRLGYGRDGHVIRTDGVV